MTFKQYISEEYLKTSNKGFALRTGVTDMEHNVSVEIWKNPTPAEIARYKEVRLVLWKGNLYAWQSDTQKGWIEHRHTIKDIGITDKKFITMTYDRNHGLEVAWYEMDNNSSYGGMLDGNRKLIKRTVETNINVKKAFGANVRLHNLGGEFEDD